MIARTCVVCLSLGLAAAATELSAQTQPTGAQPNGTMKPLAMVSISGYDELKSDINFLGSLAGQENLSQQFEPFLMGFVQDLDKSKPLGLIVQSDGMAFGGAICLPIGNLTQFLGNLAMFQVQTSDAGNGITQVTAQGQNLFAKQGDGWAFLSMSAQMLENLPADPGTVLAPLSKEYDLGVRVHIQNIPVQFRMIAIENMKAGMDAGMKQMEGESDENFQARKQMTEVQVNQLIRVINEMDELTIGFAVDAPQQRTLFDIVYTAVPGSQLAQQIAEVSDVTTNFAGFFQPDATGMLMFASKIHESDLAQMEQMISAARKQIITAIDEESELPTDEAKETAKSAANDFVDAVLATIKTGTMDGGAVLHLSPTSTNLVAGGFIGDPSKVESGLKKLAELGKSQPDVPEVKWNADSHHGVNFHTMSVPVPSEEPRQMFGETLDLAVGIGKNSVFFAAGRDCIAAAKKVIDDSAANRKKPVAPMELTVSVGQILETISAFDDDPTLAMVAQSLKAESAGRDHVHLVAQPIENGLRTRFELEEGVIRAIGKAVEAKQAQAAGAR